MAKRFYVVTMDGKERLIEASYKGQAVRYCMKEMVQVRPATVQDVAELMTQGILIEKVKEEEK